MYEGARVQADETPAMLNMEDGDQIDAHIEQVSFIISFLDCNKVFRRDKADGRCVYVQFGERRLMWEKKD